MIGAGHAYLGGRGEGLVTRLIMGITGITIWVVGVIAKSP